MMMIVLDGSWVLDCHARRHSPVTSYYVAKYCFVCEQKILKKYIDLKHVDWI